MYNFYDAISLLTIIFKKRFFNTKRCFVKRVFTSNVMLLNLKFIPRNQLKSCNYFNYISQLVTQASKLIIHLRVLGNAFV